MTTPRRSAKHRRESKLLDELQRDHGYMLARMPRSAERTTTQVRGIGSRKISMVPARVTRLIVPDTSLLGRGLAEQEKIRSRDPAKRRAR